MTAGEHMARRRRLKPRYSDAEHARVVALAERAGLPIETYVRQVSLGVEPRAVLDHDAIQSLLKVAADLGRFGGLLKLFLTDDARLSRFDRRQVEAAIAAGLRATLDNQERIAELARRALHDRGRP